VGYVSSLEGTPTIPMAFKFFLEFQKRSQKRDTGIPKIHSKSGEMDVVGSIGLPFWRPLIGISQVRVVCVQTSGV